MALLLVAVAAALGAAAGVKPLYGVAGAVGLALLAVMLADLATAVVVFTVASFLDVIQLGGSVVSGAKIAGAVLLASWLASAARSREARPERIRTTVTPFAFAFVAWAGVSMVWAFEPSVARTSLSRYALDAVLFPIVLAGVRRRRDAIAVVAAFVLGSLIAAGYGIVHPGSPMDPNRLSGAAGDPNDLAAVLVAAIALTAGLFEYARRSPLATLGLATTVALALYAIIRTQSRGGLVGLAVMLFAGCLIGGPWRRKLISVTVLAALIAAYFALLAPGAAGRFSKADTSGRSTIWAVAVRVIKANPVAGVGAGDFQQAAPQYLVQPGATPRADLIIDTPKVAHSLYLETTADLGFVGLALFLAMIAASLRCALKAAIGFQALGDRVLEVISRSVVIATVGLLAADVFISTQYSKQLWLLLAFGPALLALQRRMRKAASPTGSTGSIAGSIG
jgi:O-antigen ligase